MFNSWYSLVHADSYNVIIISVSSSSSCLCRLFVFVFAITCALLHSHWMHNAQFIFLNLVTWFMYEVIYVHASYIDVMQLRQAKELMFSFSPSLGKGGVYAARSVFWGIVTMGINCNCQGNFSELFVWTLMYFLFSNLALVQVDLAIELVEDLLGVIQVEFSSCVFPSIFQTVLWLVNSLYDTLLNLLFIIMSDRFVLYSSSHGGSIFHALFINCCYLFILYTFLFLYVHHLLVYMSFDYFQ